MQVWIFPVLLASISTLVAPLRTEGIVYVGDQGFELRYGDGPIFQPDPFPFAGVSPGLAFLDPREPLRWWDISELSRDRFQTVFGGIATLPTPARLEPGVEIWEALEWRGMSVDGLASMDGEGNFFDTEGFLPIRAFDQNSGWEIEGALTYYGWIRVSHSADDAVLTVHDWAWNSTPGEAILAGQIPEPAAYAIMFALGVLGFVIFRRRRRNGSASA